MANEYLQRTPTSTGNRSVFTWAGWVKVSDTSSAIPLFGVFHGGSSRYGYLTISSSELQFFVGEFTTGSSTSYNTWIESTRLLRDFGNWMHVMVLYNSTKSVVQQRVNLYINGKIIDDLTVNNLPGVNSLSYFGSLHPHFVGAWGPQADTANQAFEGQMSDLFYVDGQALGPDVFGFYKDGDGYQSSGSSHATDFRPGQWMPHAPSKIKKDINRRGGFGVNGFYLPMNDSSNPGADFHMTPNSIIKLKGEDLPQPRNGAPTTSDAYVSQLRQETGTLGFDGIVKLLRTGGYLDLGTGHSDLVPGSGDFTIECFLYPQGFGNYPVIVDSRTSSNDTLGFFLGFNTNGQLYLYTHSGERNAIILTKGRWYHIALVRQSNVFKLYVDGVKVGTDYTQSQNYSNQIRYIGESSNSESQNWNIDAFISNFRFVKGTAVYTGNFTAPSAPLTNVTNTKLLCCNSSTSATAATVTPGTITANGNAFATRNDLTASILLAVPGITGGQGSGYGDYSADIKGSGTNKTITANNNATVSATASYYGSAMAFDGTTDSFQYTVPNSDALFLQNTSFTMECWVYPNTSFTDDRYLIFLGNGSSSNNNSCYYLRIYDTYYQGIMVNSNNQYATTSVNTYKSEQWTHVAYVRDGNEQRLYINGVCEAVTTHSILPNVNNSSTLYIGSAHGLNNSINAQIQDVRIYDGVAKYKGGFDVPKPYTPVGIEAFRTTADTCKNNFATLNPLAVGQNTPAYLDGNLSYSNTQGQALATMGVSSGKMYWEVYMTGTNAGIGLAVEGVNPADYVGKNTTSWVYYVSGGKYTNYVSHSTISSYGASYTAGDIIGVALDCDSGNLTFYKNGVSQGVAFTGFNDGRTYFPAVGSANGAFKLNFGQNPSFCGTVTAGTNTDSNGKGLFKYAVPSGFLALCEDNLPTPAIADPGDHFKTVLYTGTNTNRSITGVGFKPGFVWTKERNGTEVPAFYDEVRKPPNVLYSSETNSEENNSGYLHSFDDDGFTVGTADLSNNAGGEYVAWCWKAGGAAVSNSDGSITTQVSANQTSGFSIVTGTMTSGTDTLGHGLSQAPELIITKQTNGTTGWYTWHKGIPITETLRLDTTSAAASFSHWVTLPTNSVFSMGSGFGSSEAYVAYCWHSVEGFSKIGSYVGNGSSDGPFEYCGFKPAFVLWKNISNSSGNNWYISDSARSSSNPVGSTLAPNTNAVEDNAWGAGIMDFTSNGFKIRRSPADTNTDGHTFIFAAFAESPFKTANAK